MNTDRLITLLVLAFMTLSCSRELVDLQGGHGDVREVEMKVSLPDALVKTCLGSKDDSRYQTLWCEGDAISLNGLKSSTLTADAAGRNTASFMFKGNITYPYNLLYPATDEVDKVVFPSVQQYIAGTFDPVATPMYSSSRSFENSSLSHLSSLLKFSLTSAKSVTLSQIQVTSMGGENLSGVFAMKADEDGLFTGEMVQGEGSVSTALVLGEEGLQLSSEPAGFYVSIPHGVYSKGFTALVITDDDQVMSLKFYTKDGETTVAPAKVIEFETVEFESAGSMLLIKSVDDLKALETSQESYPEAVLVSDLDFTGVEWTPLNEISLHLNGAGHTLKGLNAPLCKTLTGTVKDMTIVADITATSGTTVAAFAEVVNGSDASLINCVSKGCVTYSVPSSSGTLYVAGLAGQVKGGAQIEGCSNRAEVKVSAEAGGTVTLNLSGLVAYVADGASLKNSENDGIVCSYSKSMKYQYIGGCVAECVGSLENVVNKGEVHVGSEVAPTDRLYVGGVIGYLKSVNIASAVNAGSVAVAGHTPTQNFVGGVVGFNAAARLDNTMVSNVAGSSVSYTVSSDANQPAVGGIVGMCQANGVTMSSLVNNSDINVTFPAGVIAKKDIKIGGVTGYFYYSGTTQLTCEKCVNKGMITVSGQMKATESMSNGVQIGGILGRCQITGTDSQIEFTITDCRNEGDIFMNESDGSRYVFAGGVIGTYSVLNTKMSGCSNSGNITKNGNSAGSVYMGGICGSAYRGAVSSHIWSKCVNSGKIAVYDAMSSAEMAAGGLIGNVSGTSGKALTMSLSECSNSGNIDRLTTEYNKSTYSYAGGLIGVVGRAHMKISSDANVEGYVTLEIRDCKNSGNVIFNQFTGFDSFVETTTDITFTGGIVGLSAAEYGTVDVVCCENSGNILSTSGQHGGIVGFMRNGTTVRGEKTSDGVRYTVNTGNVGDHNPSGNGLTGSGYCIAGGIAGYLKGNCSIEYSSNSGCISGSVSAADTPSAGGIVGKYLIDGAVRYCKNSGYIRNYKSSKSSSFDCSGAITGTNAIYSSANCGVRYCGVGGRVYRSSGWIILDEGATYPWQNYIFRNTPMLNDDKTPVASYPADVYYKGCCFWDGASQLPWEKSDWVEPEE